MENLNNVVQISGYFLQRDGFIFAAMNHPANVYNAIVVRNPEDCPLWSPQYPVSKHSLQDHIDLINKYELEKAIIIADDISFITECKSLKYISVYPADTAPEGFDYSPLYSMPEIRSLSCTTEYGGSKCQKTTTIDYSKINGLLDLCVCGKGHLNFDKAETVKSLHIADLKIENLSCLSNNKELDTLRVITTGIKTLAGIENLNKMTCMYLRYNRSLRDISAIGELSGSLKALRIENCSKIKDFSVLEKLENLELLEITGSNALPSLQFIKKMKNLKTFLFNVDVQDGDLTPCFDLDYVFCGRGRKHFNLKDKDLPKGKYTRGNEDIEEWRRLE